MGLPVSRLLCGVPCVPVHTPPCDCALFRGVVHQFPDVFLVPVPGTLDAELLVTVSILLGIYLGGTVPGPEVALCFTL